jgi:hypothetical protein
MTSSSCRLGSHELIAETSAIVAGVGNVLNSLPEVSENPTDLVTGGLYRAGDEASQQLNEEEDQDENDEER